MSVFFGFLGARFSEFSPQGNPSVCHGRQLPLHRGATGSRCPPGVDRLVFSLIGRRYFGGRGELRSPLSSHRNVFSKHPGVPVGLFSTKSTQYSLLQNARPPGSLRSPSDAAPKCFFKTFRCSGRLIFRFRTDPPSVRRCSTRLIRQAETLELQPRSRPPSSHTVLFSSKRSTSSRFAASGGRGACGPPAPPAPAPALPSLASAQAMVFRRRTDGKAERLASCAVSFFRRKVKPLASGAPKAPPVPPWFLPCKG